MSQFLLLLFIFNFFVVVQGVIDLFRLPYEQYQRDGRIVRGIQLGAQSFTSRTALAALELTTRLIYLLQVCEPILNGLMLARNFIFTKCELLFVYSAIP